MQIVMLTSWKHPIKNYLKCHKFIADFKSFYNDKSWDMGTSRDKVNQGNSYYNTRDPAYIEHDC